ncbi:DNA primase [subsurface metagenome]
MATTYKEAKSVVFISDIIRFAEKLLGIRFWKTGKYSYSAYCPFHNDRKDSFRVYVDKYNVVRFHCYGCPFDCDIYQLIQLKRKCSFHQAQQIFADYLGIEDFVFYRKGSSELDTVKEDVEEEDPVSFIEPPEPDPQIIAAMNDAVRFYNELIISHPDKFAKVFRYLTRRGVDQQKIRDFHIGYAPPFKDENFEGRALLYHFHGRFKEDWRNHWQFVQAGLARLINGDRYFHRYVDPSKDAFIANYADFFAGRLTFPVYNVDGRIHGIVARRPDNAGTRWMKQQGAVNAKSWLYGIDKAHQAILHYKTVIIVEGIFDYFAVYNLLQNTSKPIVISTLGSNLTDEALSFISGLGVENYVIAFDWDAAGKKAIMKAQNALGVKVYYLGGMEEDQDPAEKLKDVVGAVDGFSLKHLMAAAKRTQDKSSKPINISYITSGPAGKRNVMLNPVLDENDSLPVPKNLTDQVKDYYYNVDDFLPLLSYDNGNQAALKTKLYEIHKLLETKPVKPESDNCFKIPADFISTEAYDDLGAALILWLWVAIHQQKNKRRVVGIDSELGSRLNTSRTTFNKYKQQLKKLGYLNIKLLKKGPGLSVRYFPKG